MLSVYWHTTRNFGNQFTLADWVEQYTQRAVAAPAFAKWVNPQGQFSSPESFKAWIQSAEFADWYESKTGEAWPHSTNVVDLTTNQVAELVDGFTHGSRPPHHLC